MEFIVLIITLVLRELVGFMPRRRHDHWFYRLVSNVTTWFRPKSRHLYESVSDRPRSTWKWLKPLSWLSGTGAFIVSVLLPVVALSFVLQVLESFVMGIPAFLASTLVLLYSLGRKDSIYWLTRFKIAWHQRDIQGAYQYATEILPGESIDNDSMLWQKVFARLIVIRFRDIFFILFWFMLLGAEGALLVRLTLLFVEYTRQQKQHQQDQHQQDRPQGYSSYKIDRFCYWLEWLPVRLLGICFMLAGHFTNGKQWLDLLLNRTLGHEQILSGYALMALGFSVKSTALELSGGELIDGECKDEPFQLLDQLLKRSSVLWILGIAFVVIAL